MANKSFSRTIADQILYPHLKITNERFPRLLATRRILDKSDEYFGAFLPATNVRLWLFQLNKLFRLRSCEIDVDGSFEQPCQMYFAKKCLAPCVAEICGDAEYLENVAAMRVFLGGTNEGFAELIEAKISICAENLEFEKAARWRDLLSDALALKSNKKLQISIATAVDVYDYEETENETKIQLFTARGRKFAGNMEFVFDRRGGLSLIEMYEQIIRNFYVFDVPKEIRLPIFYPNRVELEKYLKDKFGRKVKISFHQNELNLTAQFRLKRTKLDFELDKISGRLSANQIKTAVKKLLKLKKKPHIIECFDVAHLSNQNFVTASSVWENGGIRPEKSTHFILDVENEPAAMAAGICERLKINPAPDLIIIDGGKGQLNAVLNEITQPEHQHIAIISVVKPPGKHNEISHLLTPDGGRINFETGNQVFELFRRLRDDSHRTANELHRQLRENLGIHAKNLPLVPIRFDETDGAAEDLIPIKKV